MTFFKSLLGKSILDRCRSATQTVLFLFLAAIGLIALCGTPLTAWQHAVPVTLSRYIPDYDYLIKFQNDRSHPDLVRLQEYERYYRKVNELMNLFSSAQTMHGFCLYYTGKVHQARYTYEKAIKMDPKYFNAYFNLGMIAIQEGKLKTAKAHLMAGLKIDPLTYLRYVVSSRVYRPFLPFAPAAQALADGVVDHITEGYHRAYVELLDLCEKTKDYSTMKEYAQQAIRKNFQQTGVFRYYLSMALFHEGEYEKAIVSAQEAIKENFEFAEAFSMMGQSINALGRPEGRDVLERARNLEALGHVFASQAKNRDLLLY